MAWLQAIADRAACSLMAVEGSVLFSEENAKLVTQHFSNVLESMVPDDAEEGDADWEPESENDEGGN